MNNTFKRIPLEKTLFFDIEAVRKQKDLDPNSKEFELYRKKLRNKETDELPSVEDTLEDYSKRAALKIGYDTIVTIGVGFVRAGEVFIKALTGSEEEILKEFFSISSQFDYICGFNILGYDLPHCYTNAAKYFDYTTIVKDAHNTIGKKPWNLDKVVDLFDILKGTSYTAMSFDEALYHFGLNSSKTEIDGSQVSETWYSGEEDMVVRYVKQDVFETINLFQKMQFNDAFTDYVDRSKVIEKPVQLSPLEMIYNSDYFSDDVKNELRGSLKKKRLTKKDRDFIQVILESAFIKDGMFNKDSIDVQKAKVQEIEEFLTTV